MTEIPEPLRRAMEAQAAATGKIDVAAVVAEIESRDPIPTDAEEIARQEVGRVPAVAPDGPQEAVHAAVDVQESLLDDALPPLRYENLLPADDVATYKRVKRWTMALASDARAIVAEIVGGTIGDDGRSRKEFVQTARGKFRISMGHMSDNSTEVAAHERMGVRTVHLDEPDEVVAFFEEHGVSGRDAYTALVRRLRRRF